MPPLEVSEVLRELVIKMERMDSKLEQIVDKIDKLEKKCRKHQCGCFLTRKKNHNLRANCS